MNEVHSEGRPDEGEAWRRGNLAKENLGDEEKGKKNFVKNTEILKHLAIVRKQMEGYFTVKTIT